MHRRVVVKIEGSLGEEATQGLMGDLVTKLAQLQVSPCQACRVDIRH